MSCNGGAVKPGTDSNARSRTGSNARTFALHCSPCASSTWVFRSPATTCAFVTTSPGRATQPLPSWISRHARPVTFTTERRTRASTAALNAVLGGVPGFGGSSSGPSADGYGASDTARPHAANCDGCSGPQRSTSPTTHESRAIRAGHPFAVASDGIVIHTSTRTPSEPIAAPATAFTRESCLLRRASLLGEQQSGVGQKACVGNHAMIGTDRLTLHVPASLKHLDRVGHAEGRVRELFS